METEDSEIDPSNSTFPRIVRVTTVKPVHNRMPTIRDCTEGIHPPLPIRASDFGVDRLLNMSKEDREKFRRAMEAINSVGQSVVSGGRRR